MHDAISAEQLGIPAAAIVTDHFVRLARVMAGTLGLPDYPCVVIPHPLSHNTEDELDAKADEAARQCIALLQNPERARWPHHARTPGRRGRTRQFTPDTA